MLINKFILEQKKRIKMKKIIKTYFTNNSILFSLILLDISSFLQFLNYFDTIYKNKDKNFKIKILITP